VPLRVIRRQQATADPAAANMPVRSVSEACGLLNQIVMMRDDQRSPDVAFYEEGRELGEVTEGGLRYRLYYDPERQCTIDILIPGQDDIVNSK